LLIAWLDRNTNVGNRCGYAVNNRILGRIASTNRASSINAVPCVSDKRIHRSSGQVVYESRFSANGPIAVVEATPAEYKGLSDEITKIRYGGSTR